MEELNDLLAASAGLARAAKALSDARPLEALAADPGLAGAISEAISENLATTTRLIQSVAPPGGLSLVRP